jgi:hypothetical protein
MSFDTYVDDPGDQVMTADIDAEEMVTVADRNDN